MIRLKICTRKAFVVETQLLTSGSVGIEVEFSFSDAWDDLNKVAVFRGSGANIDMVLTGDSCTVPPEVLAQPGGHLMIGAYGTNGAGTIVIPTVWANAGPILLGAIPSGIEPEEITPSLLQQLLDLIHGGSGELYIVDYDQSASTRPDVDEIAAAFDSGKAVLACATDGDGGGHVLPLTAITRESGAVTALTFYAGGWSLHATKVFATWVWFLTEIEPPAEDLVLTFSASWNDDAEAYAVTTTATRAQIDEALAAGQRIEARLMIDNRQLLRQGTVYAERYGSTLNSVTIGFIGEAGEIWELSGTGGGWELEQLAIGGSSIELDTTLSKPGEAADAAAVGAALANKGTYSKPSGGIPKTDLASAVQTSLDKADTALQSVPSTYRTAEAQDSIDASQDTAIAGKLSTTGDAYRAVSLPMGHLDSTSTATVMTATVPGITELRDGVFVWLHNGVITSASGVTLNINGLGAKPIYNSLSGAVVTTTFTAASTYLFVYNSTRVTGGCWDMVYGYDTNTTYTPAKLGQGYAVCSTAAATVAKTASISSYTLVAGGIVAIKFTNDVPANATLNITSKGAKAIYYKGAAITDGVIKAGDTVTMIYSTYYHVLSIDRGIPAPSDSTPARISAYETPGVSNEYARADHQHFFDLVDSLFGVPSVNIAVFLYDGANGVYIREGPQDLAGAFRSQLKINFALVVPPNYNSYPVLFTPSKFDTATGELHLTGIVSGVLYEATLLPGADPTGQFASVVMVGTMTTTNLALPNAQGVSF